MTVAEIICRPYPYVNQKWAAVGNWLLMLVWFFCGDWEILYDYDVSGGFL